MVILNPKEVKEKLDKKKRGEYFDLIHQLPVGAAIRIDPSEWFRVRKEQPNHYFLVRFQKLISTRFIDGYYYIIRI